MNVIQTLHIRDGGVRMFVQPIHPYQRHIFSGGGVKYIADTLRGFDSTLDRRVNDDIGNKILFDHLAGDIIDLALAIAA